MSRAAVLLLILLSLPVRAETPSSDLDGLYVTLGPVGGAVRVGGEWLSAVGLEASLVRLTEGRIPVLWGGALGGVSYAGRDGGRLWLEAEAAVRDPLPIGVGLGVGIAAEIGPSIPTRVGIQGTLWFFAGVIPYVRAGALSEAGGFVEIGLMIKLPAVRFR